MTSYYDCLLRVIFGPEAGLRADPGKKRLMSSLYRVKRAHLATLGVQIWVALLSTINNAVAGETRSEDKLGISLE